MLTTHPQYRALPLGAVHLNDSPFKVRMEANRSYLTHLDPHRLLHNFYEHAGLPTHGEVYGGWESQGVAGHTLGHYLTAISQQVAATGDPELLKREREIVEALSACQAKRGTGYVGGIPNEDKIWEELKHGDVRSQGFDLNGGWVPWYTVHKLFAGLIDAYHFTHDEKALDVVKKLGDWAIDLLKDMDEPTFQRMLACEHGGMNDALAQLSEITGDKRYLALAQRFFHHAILDPLVEGRDELAGKHANTQIPKVIGLVKISQLTGDVKLLNAAEFFWERVTQHHSYVIGGNSDHEHFGKPDQLSDRLSTNTCETCNTYNMLKLSKDLFEITGEWKYMDYYEHALVNHILASQDPANGMVCYYVSLQPGTARTYSTPDDSFWCCVGTGIENHTKYGEAIAFRKGNGLSIANYLSCEIDDPVSGFELEVKTHYPLDGEVTVRIKKAPAGDAPLEFRIPPYCATIQPFTDQGIQTEVKGHSFTIKRTWKPSETVRFKLDFASTRLIAMPDNPDRMAVVIGPTVYAAVLPGDASARPFDVVGTPQLDLGPGVGLQIQETAGHSAATLKPFWQLTHEKTAVYLDVYSKEKWNAEAARREAIRAAQAELDRRTVDVLRPGEMQDERDHEVTGEKTDSGDNGGNKWRHAVDGGWFSFHLAVDPALSNELRLTFWGNDGEGRDFDLLADGKVLHTYRFDGSQGARLYDVTLPIPAELTVGKNKILIRFQAKPGKMAGGLYGARILRAKP